MKDLIESFTPTQIIIFIILGSLAIKGVWDMIDFFKNKYKEKFNKDVQKLTFEEEVKKNYLECKEQHEETLELYDKIDHKLDKLATSMENLSQRVDRLTVSDRNDIRQYIVREYHFFVENQKWIDDYSLDCILQRFEDYREEGGNSYIHTLVEEIKKLPKRPPKED